MVIVITGPTGVGKTKLSIELAKKLNGEIINADSTQVYKGLNIATAKVTETEKEGISHHLIDIKNVEEDYTVFNYQADCREKIKEISERGHVPILVGGTGLYIKSALYNYQFEIEIEKKELVETTEELHQQLLRIDPNTDIHPHNRKRMIRALERYEETKIPPSKEMKAEICLYDCVIIGLTTDRDFLYNCINKRVDIMVKEGLLEEAKEIYDSKIRTKAIMTPIGYKELFPYFDNQISLEDALNMVKQKSRNYAKKQYTWWNHQMPVRWFPVCFEDFDKTVEDVYQYIQGEF